MKADLLKAKHPAGDLLLGQSKRVGDVIFRLEPHLETDKASLVGISSARAEAIASALGSSDSDSLTEAQLETEWQVIASATADYFGQLLPTEKRLQLRHLYTTASENSATTAKTMHDGKMSLDDARQSMIETMTKLVVGEAHILADEPEAQARRYSKWQGALAGDPAEHQALVKKAFERMFAGDYLQADADILEKEQAILQVPGSPEAKELGRQARIHDDFIPHVFEPILLPTRETVVDREAYSYEVRIYSAEHSVLGSDLDEALGVIGFYPPDLGCVHVSILAGIWQNYKERRLRETFIDDHVTTETKLTVYGDQFHSWVVANGSASWLKADDDLYLKHVAVFPTFEEARQYAKGQTATSGGKYYPVRACAYSVGAYGVNWVCHQNSNAFTLRKWGFLAVDYPSTAIYGTCGNHWQLSISRREDPIWHTYPHRGGVPGNQLYYNVCLPYVTPEYVIFDALMNAFGSGGYGLDEKWDVKNGWNPTYARFVWRAVPICGTSKVHSTEPGW
jgi:hypothetical protein